MTTPQEVHDRSIAHAADESASTMAQVFVLGSATSAGDRYEIGYDDPEATKFPILLNDVPVGSIVSDERYYRARREAGGMAYLGPGRAFAEQSLADFIRWMESPLGNLCDWTEGPNA